LERVAESAERMASRLGRAGLSAIGSTPTIGGYSPSNDYNVTSSYDALSGLIADKAYSSPTKSGRASTSIYDEEDDDGNLLIDYYTNLFSRLLMIV